MLRTRGKEGQRREQRRVSTRSCFAHPLTCGDSALVLDWVDKQPNSPTERPGVGGQAGGDRRDSTAHTEQDARGRLGWRTLIPQQVKLTSSSPCFAF